MKVVISAGGTGGHIYPATALINKIKEFDSNVEFLYIGTTDRMEKDIIPNLGIDYVGIPMKGLSKNPLKLVKFSYLILNGIRKCKKILKEFKPDIVLTFGGYVTVPVVLAAKSLKIKSILHEQNSVPGKANLFLSKYTNTICCSLPSSMKYFEGKNVVLSGNPRADEAISAKKANKLKYGLSLEKKLVLITTGSQGAETVNEKITSMLGQMDSKNYEVMLVSGKNSDSDTKKGSYNNVKIVPYLEDMLEVMKATDLIVSRAGATIISEITALGLPSILIPSPYVPNNHQYLNAKDLEDVGATILIEENNLTDILLLNEIDKVLNNPDIYKKMSEASVSLGIKNSSTIIISEIKKLLK